MRVNVAQAVAKFRSSTRLELSKGGWMLGRRKSSRCSGSGGAR